MDRRQYLKFSKSTHYCYKKNSNFHTDLLILAEILPISITLSRFLQKEYFDLETTLKAA